MNTTATTKIIGLVPNGTDVTIRHDGHPLDGATVNVIRSTGSTGGSGGGGAVMVSIPTGDDRGCRTEYVSRYTRVTES